MSGLAEVPEEKDTRRWIDELSFDERGLLPAIVQDERSGSVLMLAWVNKEALLDTLKSGKTVFWSRSRSRIWRKGETSGNYQTVKEILYDCDGDTLLIKVDPAGPACHTGHGSCFFRSWNRTGIEEIDDERPSRRTEDEAGTDEGDGVRAENVRDETRTEGTLNGPRAESALSATCSEGVQGEAHAKCAIDVVASVYEIVQGRKKTLPAGSYVASLMVGGQDRILKKIPEEAGEVVIASKNVNQDEIIYEMADLWFHCLVALAFHDIRPDEVFAELGKRRKPE